MEPARTVLATGRSVCAGPGLTVHTPALASIQEHTATPLPLRAGRRGCSPSACARSGCRCAPLAAPFPSSSCPSALAS